MTSSDIRALLREPFRPLSLWLSDGSRIVVDKSEHAQVAFTTLMVGEQHDATGWPRSTRWIDVRHIVQATQSLDGDSE